LDLFKAPWKLGDDWRARVLADVSSGNITPQFPDRAIILILSAQGQGQRRRIAADIRQPETNHEASLWKISTEACLIHTPFHFFTAYRSNNL
jgi:hypothetical protein